MIKVQIRPNEPVDAALRRFKRQCNYAGIFRLSKKYAYYEKRSDRLRREERERIRNIQRMARKFTRTKTRTARKSKVKATQLGDGTDDSEVGVSAISAVD